MHTIDRNKYGRQAHSVKFATKEQRDEIAAKIRKFRRETDVIGWRASRLRVRREQLERENPQLRLALTGATSWP